eukprot:TRINITY_DN852_c0_g1_i4.p1 TRINITY_DN852_c0_g1~~TRINITY_DN852_c0_g1_i4.p1  ORF type:complete len:351 (+),score=48.89 TRINITY_DN852_c0_g1_i4:202-1254(+)
MLNAGELQNIAGEANRDEDLKAQQPQDENCGAGLGIEFSHEKRRQSISSAMLQNILDLKEQNDNNKKFVRQSIIPDIDAGDAENPHAVATYAKDIYLSYRVQESEFAPRCDYMSCQPHLKPRFRTILVDWLVGVCYQLRLLNETFYLAVNVLDRFLSCAEVKKEELQLVGVTALLIASKYEEVRHPSLDTLVKMCGYLYDRNKMRRMERRMLEKLDYLLSGATQFHYLSRYLKAAGIEKRSELGKQLTCLVQYLVGITTLDFSFLEFKYSKIVVAAIFLAMRVKNVQDALPYALQKHSNYSLGEIKPCAKKVYSSWKVIIENPHVKTFRKVYKREEVMQVANMQVPDIAL